MVFHSNTMAWAEIPKRCEYKSYNNQEAQHQKPDELQSVCDAHELQDKHLREK